MSKRKRLDPSGGGGEHDAGFADFCNHLAAMARMEARIEELERREAARSAQLAPPPPSSLLLPVMGSNNEQLNPAANQVRLAEGLHTAPEGATVACLATAYKMQKRWIGGYERDAKTFAMGLCFGGDDSRNGGQWIDNVGTETDNRADLYALIACMNGTAHQQPLVVCSTNDFMLDIAVKIDWFVDHAWKKKNGEQLPNADVWKQYIVARDQRTAYMLLVPIAKNALTDGMRSAFAQARVCLQTPNNLH